jgi:hypothetical protein
VQIVSAAAPTFYAESFLDMPLQKAPKVYYPPRVTELLRILTKIYRKAKKRHNLLLIQAETIAPVVKDQPVDSYMGTRSS